MIGARSTHAHWMVNFNVFGFLYLNQIFVNTQLPELIATPAKHLSLNWSYHYMSGPCSYVFDNDQWSNWTVIRVNLQLRWFVNVSEAFYA